MCVKLGGGARAVRTLRLLLLLVLALTAVKYINFGSIPDASSLQTYLYIPGYNATPAAHRNEKYTSWAKRIIAVPEPRQSSQATLIQKSTGNPTKAHESQFTKSSVHISSTVSKKTETNKLINKKSSNSYWNLKWNLFTRIIEIQNNWMTTPSSYLQNKFMEINMCPRLPPDLGPVKVNTSVEVLDIVDNKFPEVSWGGRYSPPNCIPRHKVAIIVPYRDREPHLPIFLNHMHPFLMKQQLEYGIFIIEQSGINIFNKGKLMNVGFIESQKLKQGGWQCFIFHDVDLLPLDGRNLYFCQREPRHMSICIDRYNFTLIYKTIFGGVTAMTREQIIKVNGFSNKYWGWGGEDDDMYIRLRKSHYRKTNYKMTFKMIIARYMSLNHTKAIPNPKRYEMLSRTKTTFLMDGLNTLEYELVNISQHHLYTHILVNVDERINRST